MFYKHTTQKGFLMRRLLWAWLLVLIMGVSVSVTFAIGAENPDLTRLLMYVPRNANLVVALRSDEEYINTLNDLYARIATQLPDILKRELPRSLDINDLLAQAFDTATVKWADFRDVLGDVIVISTDEPFDAFSGNTSNFENIHMVVAHTDKQSIQDLFALDGIRTTQEGDFEVGEAGNFSFALNDDVLILTNTETLIPRRSLADDRDFADMLPNLPNEDYNILLYTPPGLSTGFLMGFDIEDENNLIIDLVSEAAPGLPTVAITQMGESIPDDTDLLVEAMDFAGTLEVTLDVLEQAQGSQITRQFEQVFAILGLDLQRDVLSWTDGYVAVFASVNTPVLSQIVFSGGDMSNLEVFPAEFGLVFEATQPRKAREVAQKLGVGLGILASQTVKLSPTEVGTLEGTEINIELPVTRRRSVDLTLFVGANDDIFYFGTKNAAQKIVDGETLANDPTYQNARRYYLDGASQGLYSDDDGAGAIGLLVATVLAPMSSGRLQDTRQMIQADITPDTVAEIIRVLETIVDSASISSVPRGEYIVNRAVLTLK
jgi:hypothetical protein